MNVITKTVVYRYGWLKYSSIVIGKLYNTIDHLYAYLFYFIDMILIFKMLSLIIWYFILSYSFYIFHQIK